MSVSGACSTWFCLCFVCVITCAQDYTCQCQSPEQCEYCLPVRSCTRRNVGLGRPATASSLYTSTQYGNSGPACLAVDGNNDDTFQTISWNPNYPQCVHTANDDHSPYWEVDLGRPYVIDNIVIYGRTESNRNTVRDAKVAVDDTVCYTFPSDYRRPVNVNISSNLPLTGSKVKVYKVNVSFEPFMALCEVQVWVNCADNGFYGPQCLECGHCKERPCDANSGTCQHGCDRGWKGDKCDQECDPGFYGFDCQTTCGKCKTIDTCNSVNGSCLSGCQAGYQSQYCTESCTAGSYGDGCSSRCGNCKNTIDCDAISGSCPDGCDSGWHGDGCDQPCPDNTYGEGCSQGCGECSNWLTCNKTTGHCYSCQTSFLAPLCKDCEAGKYGENCNRNCTNCGGDGSCDKSTANCTSGCSDGWTSDNCSLRCPSKVYGKDCVESCGQCRGNTTCRHTDGHCELGCADDFSGDLCKSPISSSPQTSTALIAGVVSACVLVLIVVILVIILLIRRRSTKDNTHSPTNRNQTTCQDLEVEGRLTFDPKTPSIEVSVDDRKKDKAELVAKPVRLRTSKKDKCSEGKTSDHVYMNTVLSDTHHSTLTRTASLESLSELEDETDPTYRNDEAVYSTFISHKPQLDSVQRSLINLLASGQLLDQFKTLPKGLTDPHEVAKEKQNIKKNRFYSVLPYDKNRVILADGYREGNATDFINASFITGPQHSKTYIAAQGPRDNTVGDFWRMVWQEQISQIIMLTGLIEAGKSKCFEYWPTKDKEETYGPVTIKGIDVQRRSNFLVRTFDIKLRESGDKRRVEQYHYIAWPDHGVPTTASLLNFWRFAKARAPQRPPPPILVHCTAGVGRTGTYIGLDIAYENAVARGEVNVYDVIERMRTERCIMVQAEEQYVFLHKALLEAYTGRDTIIPNDQFEQLFPKEIKAENENMRIDREFQKVMQMRSLTPEVPVTIAKKENNTTKIRNKDALPADEHLVCIQDPRQNQFINAVFLSTYKEHQGSILTQLPLQQTLADFWKLVDQWNVRTIVSLGHENELASVHDYCQYWPKDAGTTITVDKYVIKHRLTSALGNCLMSYMIILQKGASFREVQLLHYTDWVGELPGNTSQLLQLIDSVESLRLRDQKPVPVVIQCLDGVTKSGLFCALSHVLHRLSSDKDVDVYMAVREVHTIRPQAISSVVQYRYCYLVAQQRLREISVYANT